MKNFTEKWLVLILFTAVGCVSDIDVNQFDKAGLDHDLYINLFSFSATSNDFTNKETGEVNYDPYEFSIPLEFMNEEFLQENLVNIVLHYEFENSLSHSVEGVIQFLKGSSNVRYQFPFHITPSLDGDFVISQFDEIINEEGVKAIKSSNKFKVIFNLIDNNIPIEGALNFQSQGVFKFVY